MLAGAMCARLAIDKLEAPAAAVAGPVEKLGDGHSAGGELCERGHSVF